MKLTFQTFLMDIRRALGSVKFFLAIVGVYLVYYASIVRAGGGDVLTSFRFVTEVGSFNHIMILFLVLPYTTSFCVDWNTKYIRSVVIRTGSGRYAVSKIISCALSAGIAGAFGIIVFIGTLALKVPLVPTDLTELQGYVTRNVGGGLLFNGHYIMYFAICAYLIFLLGAFWSVVGLCVSAYIPNKFVALFTPLIVDYAIANTTQIFPKWLRISEISEGFCIINNTFISLLYATLFFIVLIVGVGLLFVRVTKRRLRNE